MSLFNIKFCLRECHFFKRGGLLRYGLLFFKKQFVQEFQGQIIVLHPPNGFPFRTAMTQLQMWFHNGLYFFRNFYVCVSVLGLKITDCIINLSVVFHAYPKTRTDQYSDLTPCIDDGEAIIQDLKAPVFERECSSCICSPCVFHTEDRVNICLP